MLNLFLSYAPRFALCTFEAMNTRDEGLIIKMMSIQAAYEKIGEKHRKSLDKLGE